MTVSNFDSSEPVQVQMKAGQNRTTFDVTFDGPGCDRSPTPTPTATPNSPLATPTPTVPTPISPEVKATALNYIAQEYGIPVDELKFNSPNRAVFPHINREFISVAVVHMIAGGPIYRILVDPVTLEVEPNIGEMRRLNEEAYINKYGKMDVALYDRLQAAAPDEPIIVSIWVNGSNNAEWEIVQQLAQEFPAASEAFLASRRIWDVPDEAVSQQIRQRYQELFDARISARTAPIVDSLYQKFGIVVDPNSSMPSVSVVLTKAQIAELANHPNVAMIYLTEEEATEEVDTSNGVDGGRIGATKPWSEGINGSGVRVAVLEEDQIDDATACINVVERYSVTNNYGSGHKTSVASLLSCSDLSYPGMAQGVSLTDANFGASPAVTDPHRVADLVEWTAGRIPDIPITNASFGFSGTPYQTLHWIDRVVDYWTRRQYFLLIKSAGNQGGGTDHITSPGKAWNLLAVGSTDLGTNDVSVFSSWLNPLREDGSASDREKPELVAPGAEFYSYTINNGIVTDTLKGTSFAAPQVSGLAAMIIQANNALANYPEAMRAILMASAVRNIEGYPGIPRNDEQPQSDQKDGAGEINAAYAVEIARTFLTQPGEICEEACWWAKTTERNENDIVHTFHVDNLGKRARVAISWWANADNDANNYSFDRLDVNFDLFVEYNNNGVWERVPLGTSSSEDNNFEILDLALQEKGEYRIVVKQVDVFNDEPYNSVGIALLLYNTVYLPSIQVQ